MCMQLEAMSEENGGPVELKNLRAVALKDRLQCDCCAAAIADVHRTCSNKECGDYDMCIKCSLDARKQHKVPHPCSMTPRTCDCTVSVFSNTVEM